MLSCQHALYAELSVQEAELRGEAAIGVERQKMEQQQAELQWASERSTINARWAHRTHGVVWWIVGG